MTAEPFYLADGSTVLVPQEIVEGWDAEVDALRARVAELEGHLHVIEALAHDRSTGPAVPDTLWRIRELAQEVL